MSWQRRLGLASDRTETAALKAEVSGLQVALERCRSIAGYCERRRRAIMIGVAALALMLGVALGAGLEPITRTVSGVVQSVAPAPDVDAAFVLYTPSLYRIFLEARREITCPLTANPALEERLVAKAPLGRIGTVAEAAWPIVFLLTDAASFITGQTLVIDGGRLAAG